MYSRGAESALTSAHSGAAAALYGVNRARNYRTVYSFNYFSLCNRLAAADYASVCRIFGSNALLFLLGKLRKAYYGRAGVLEIRSFFQLQPLLCKKSYCFLPYCGGGVLSGIVEPIGAVLTILAASLIVPALPYLLSFAAGAMLYVVVEELIPEMSQGAHSNIGTVFFAVGFSLMMVLDVALG